MTSTTPPDEGTTIDADTLRDHLARAGERRALHLKNAEAELEGILSTLTVYPDLVSHREAAGIVGVNRATFARRLARRGASS